MQSRFSEPDEISVATITVPTDGPDISLAALAEDLAILEKVYRLCVGEYALAHPEELDIKNQEGAADFVCYSVVERYARLLSFSPATLISADIPMPPGMQEMRLIDIHRRNPIELMVMAVAVPLIAAVIISGGKVQFGPLLKVELAPLGDGISKLRTAFARERVDADRQMKRRRRLR